MPDPEWPPGRTPGCSSSSRPGRTRTPRSRLRASARGGVPVWSSRDGTMSSRVPRARRLQGHASAPAAPWLASLTIPGRCGAFPSVLRWWVWRGPGRADGNSTSGGSLSLELLLAKNADVLPVAVLRTGLLELDSEPRVVHLVVTARRQEQPVAVAVDGPVCSLRAREEQDGILLHAEHQFRPLLLVLPSRGHHHWHEGARDRVDFVRLRGPLDSLDLHIRAVLRAFHEFLVKFWERLLESVRLDRVQVFGRSKGTKRVLVFCFGEPHDRDESPLPVRREAVAEHEVVPHGPVLRPLALLTRVGRGERHLKLRATPDPVRDQRRALLLLRIGLVVGRRAKTEEDDGTRTSE